MSRLVTRPTGLTHRQRSRRAFLIYAVTFGTYFGMEALGHGYVVSVLCGTAVGVAVVLTSDAILRRKQKRRVPASR